MKPNLGTLIAGAVGTVLRTWLYENFQKATIADDIHDIASSLRRIAEAQEKQREHEEVRRKLQRTASMWLCDCKQSSDTNTYLSSCSKQNNSDCLECEACHKKRPAYLDPNYCD